MNQRRAEAFDLGAEISWYLENLPKLEREYSGQYILIRDRRVHQSGSSEEAILQEARKRFGHQFYVAAVGVPKPPLDFIGV